MTFPLFIFGMLLNQLQKGEAAARRVFAITDLEPSIIDNPDAKELEGNINSIEFKNVYFSYQNINTFLVTRHIVMKHLQEKMIG